MARKQSSRNTSILPVTLPGYPSCENCLAWSSDGLAVACGENVHMLTFAATSPNTVSPQLTVYTIRVNLFDGEEWPAEESSSCKNLSLGEEQSDSAVVGIAWSPSGLGEYRRSVLTILTSNLRLCFWETDGTPRSWRRTCVLNNFIETEVSATRGRNRIRCFAWTPTLHTSEDDRWGAHLLVVADDLNTLRVYRVSKHGKLILGESWQIQQLWQHDLSAINPEQPPLNELTALQNTLRAKPSITKIWVDSWELSNDGSVYVATLRCEWSCSLPPSNLVIELEAADVAAYHNAIQPWSEPSISNYANNTPVLSKDNEIPRVLHRLDSLPSWRKSLQEICQKYDHQYNLDGRYLVRLWGSSSLADLEALCFTLHPSDLYEYTTAVVQKCKLVFQTRQMVGDSEIIPDQASEDAIRDNIIQAGIHLSTNPRVKIMGIDEKILKNFKNVAAWRENGEGKRTAMQIAGQAPSEAVLDGSAEVCDLCQADIPLKTDFSSATCGQGHRYSRCSLSTLAIQEPGMSKYCSLCDREYLEHGKLNLPQELCLTRVLFDTFDVCPFCDGRYRN